jgi:hypothetical protein
MSDQHERFLERMKGSAAAVFAVAQKHHKAGHTVEIPGMRLAPTAAEAEHYIDGGDLFVRKQHRYEVKHVQLQFTNVDDYPFSSVMFSNEATVKRANGSVAAYYVVSKDMTHCAIILGSTKDHWRVREDEVKNTGNVERNYVCPKGHAIFERLLEAPPFQESL